MDIRRVGAFAVPMVAVGAVLTFGGAQLAARSGSSTVQIKGEVPVTVATGKAQVVGPHAAAATLKLNFGYALNDVKGLNALIAQEAKSHQYLSRPQLYARFSPKQQQVDQLRTWLNSNGFTVTHVGADRLALTAQASTATVEKALHVKINDYIRPGYTFGKVKVAPYTFFSNTRNPTLPAGLKLQSVSGLSDIDRFYTAAQLSGAPPQATSSPKIATGADVRSGGYFPGDIRSLYDVTGHGYDGSGQTLGFTLWGAGETQVAMNAFATNTGDTPITVDAPCVATGTPTTPSSCTTQQVAGDHLVTILENGNTNDNFGSNAETGIDIEQAHGIATHVAMKYYDGDCETAPPVGSGLANAGCNGSDVGLEDAVEDAANDPTLHTVSNSWGYGGEAEWGLQDPFLVAVQNSFAIAAAAGTTFWFSTGDLGTYESGFPADSQYVVAVGGTTLFSTADTTRFSTETTWSAAGSWCSNLIARPAWQSGAGVAANAPCSGRATPDVSAVADTNSAVKVYYTSAVGRASSGTYGGTSVAAPELNGMEAVTENLLAAQTYAGATKPAIGFEGPVIYQLGNSDQNAFYRDVSCGNTASPTAAPDGDAAQKGWDAATGWGAPDWYQFSIGYAQQLGATGLTTPSSLNQGYGWDCAKTPSNSSERSVAFPSTSTGYAVGAASGGTPWPAKFLPSNSWGATNTFFKTLDGGKTWIPSNSDMLAIDCASAATCVEVGDGGRIRRTTDSGTTWTDVPSGFDKALTAVKCPSSTVCYAAGDRGNMFKSTDGGASWSHLASTDGNPLYGLACPTADVCYATDIYAHVIKTADGGATFTWQKTPVTTPGLGVPGSGGPNPFAGLFGISCTDVNTCVAVGGYPPAGTDPPLVTTTDGGATWTQQTSNSGAGNYLHAVTNAGGTWYAVGRGGSIVTSTNLTTWTKLTSNTTNALTGITCTGATSCVATGQGGTVDVLSGGTWTASTGNGGGAFLAGVKCLDASTCFTAGKQGVTLATSNGTTWTQQAGGGTTNQMNSISCPTSATCFTVGNAGTILATKNAGQTWIAQTSGTTSALNGVACVSATSCVAAGAAGTVKYTTDGSTWSTGTSGTTNALNGVACTASSCTAVGAGGTIVASGDGGATWAAKTSGVTSALNAVACPSSTCYAAGAALLKTTDGSSWTAQTPNDNGQTLSAVTCLDASQCFAGGALGTVVTTTDGGTTWTQRGDPISGPTSALNAGPASITAINGAGCSTARCAFGTASAGDVLTSPLVYVTVKTTTPYGSAPVVTFPATSPALSVSDPAAQLQGTVTCQTTATDHSVGGAYPIGSCTGLTASGYSVVFDYASSSDTVQFPSATTPITGTVPATLSLTLGTPATFGAFTPGIDKTYAAGTTASVISSAGDATLSATAAGRLANGAFSLADPLAIALSKSSWTGPVTDDPVSIGFSQHIGAGEALRTGTYATTVTFTLSTTTP
jgi:photosystem II stability/assembly factor-like uncharacterized protein